MRIAWKLALAYAWHHPGRMLLTSLAMVAAACVVVWVVSGYDAVVAQFDDRASEYLGRYDLFLVPDSLDESFIPAELVEAIGADDTIAEFEPALQWTVQVQTDRQSDRQPDEATDKTNATGRQGPGADNELGTQGVGNRGAGRDAGARRRGEGRGGTAGGGATRGSGSTRGGGRRAGASRRGTRPNSSAPTPRRRPTNSSTDGGSIPAIQAFARRSSAVRLPNNWRSSRAKRCWLVPGPRSIG